MDSRHDPTVTMEETSIERSAATRAVAGKAVSLAG